MTDLDALLAAVLDRPADDGPRLVYADYLDDIAGDTPDPADARARAEFIRVQVELARTEPEHPPGRLLYRRAGDMAPVGVLTHPTPNIRYGELAERERYICGENVSTDSKGIKPRFFQWAEEGGLNPRWVSAPGFAPPDEVGLRRGFFERLTIPAADWLAHGDAILAAHPVRLVRLTGELDWCTAGDAILLSTGRNYVCRRATGCEVCRVGELVTARTVLEAEWKGVEFDTSAVGSGRDLIFQEPVGSYEQVALGWFGGVV